MGKKVHGPHLLLDLWKSLNQPVIGKSVPYKTGKNLYQTIFGKRKGLQNNNELAIKSDLYKLEHHYSFKMSASYIKTTFFPQKTKFVLKNSLLVCKIVLPTS